MVVNGLGGIQISPSDCRTRKFLFYSRLRLTQMRCTRMIFASLCETEQEDILFNGLTSTVTRFWAASYPAGLYVHLSLVRQKHWPHKALNWRESGSQQWIVEIGLVDSTQRLPLIFRFSRKVTNVFGDFSVSWASLPKTSILVIRLQKRVYITRSTDGPCACFPRFFT